MEYAACHNGMDIKNIKTHVEKKIESCQDELFRLSDYIHTNPELAWEEHKACEILVNFLSSHGFSIQKKAGGLETAFVAEVCATGNPYPIIDILAEYDALVIGHACGHNIIATTAAGAGVGVKEALKTYRLDGTVRVVGTPAEESGGGKIKMQEAGVFDSTDAMLLLHPTSGMSKIAGKCKSSYALKAVYKGLTAHSGSHPEDGINAADAVNICYVAIGCMRNQLEEEVQVMPVILDAGQENGLIPDTASISVKVRCFRPSILEKAVKKVKNCITAGAVATGCSLEMEEHQGYLGRVCSYVLADVVRRNFESLGEKIMPGMVDDNGGEDFGNLNRVVPGVMPYLTLLPEEKISNHTARFRELANGERSREVILLGSKGLAYSAVDLFCDPILVKRAKVELDGLRDSF